MDEFDDTHVLPQIHISDDINLYNEPRFVHNQRPVEDRIKDEKTTEYVEDAVTWNLNPNKFDVKCIDTAVQRHGNVIECLKAKKDRGKGIIEIRIVDQKSPFEDIKDSIKDDDTFSYFKEICDFVYEKNPKKDTTEYNTYIDASYNNYTKNLFIKSFYVGKKGKCYADFLMRSILNFADKNCYWTSLDAQPFGYEGLPWESKELFELKLTPEQQQIHKEKTQSLVNLYSKFGFESWMDYQNYEGYDDDTPFLHQPMFRSYPLSCERNAL